MTRVLIDTGPLIALLDRRDRYHEWARETFNRIDAAVTCDAVLTEACFILRGLAGGADAVLALVAGGILVSDFRVVAEVDAVRPLMRRFANVPMSLADACLVRMTELVSESVVVTLDSDFRVYRRNRRQIIPIISPD